jgi:hypothetical protein
VGSRGAHFVRGLISRTIRNNLNQRISVSAPAHRPDFNHSDTMSALEKQGTRDAFVQFNKAGLRHNQKATKSEPSPSNTPKQSIN